MAKSSINFKKVSTHSFKHNDRTEDKTAKTVYAEFTKNNQCNINSKIANINFNELYKKSISNVTGKTRRAAKENTLWEAVVNIKPNTKIEDLEELQKHIEKEFNFTGLQISIHRDEGHFENDKFIINHHAHLNFFTLDKQTGRQMARREHISGEKLRQLQTDTAKILNMDRGLDKRISKRERLEHKEYKKVVNSNNKELAKQKDLKQEITKLREQLQQEQAKRQDYAELEQLNRDLKVRIKAKNLTVSDLEEEIKDFKKEKEHLKSIIEVKNIEIIDLQNQNKALESEKSTLKVKLVELEEKSVSRPNMNDYDMETELKKFIEANTETVEVKKSILKNEEISVIKPTNNFFNKVIDIVAKGYQSLKVRYKELKLRFDELVQDYTKLENENANLDLAYKNLKQENKNLKEQLKEKEVPQNYSRRDSFSELDKLILENKENDMSSLRDLIKEEEEKNQAKRVDRNR